MELLGCRIWHNNRLSGSGAYIGQCHFLNNPATFPLSAKLVRSGRFQLFTSPRLPLRPPTGADTGDPARLAFRAWLECGGSPESGAAAASSGAGTVDSVSGATNAAAGQWHSVNDLRHLDRESPRLRPFGGNPGACPGDGRRPGRPREFALDRDSDRAIGAPLRGAAVGGAASRAAGRCFRIQILGRGGSGRGEPGRRAGVRTKAMTGETTRQGPIFGRFARWSQI